MTEKICETCVFYHPERKTKHCSVFREAVHKQRSESDKACAAWIRKPEEREK